MREGAARPTAGSTDRAARGAQDSRSGQHQLPLRRRRHPPATSQAKGSAASPRPSRDGARAKLQLPACTAPRGARLPRQREPTACREV